METSKFMIFPPYRAGECVEFTPVQERILRLKKEKNAVILAHNYVDPQIQDIADFVGDSLGLSRQAKNTGADIIVFAGVDFMAETAKILNPQKIVLIPDKSAGCSLEEMCDPLKLKALKSANPDAIVISYINCSAAVKELSDIICTSGNALDIVRQIPEDKQIIFCPDKHLGSWINEKTGRNMILWDGFCVSHAMYDARELAELKAEFPKSPLVCHPECPKPVRDISDCVCSTEKMIKFCRDNPAESFIIATVVEMIHRLRKEVPGKTFIAARAAGKSCQQCSSMRRNTPEKVLACLENLSPRIEVPAETASRALKPIERMLEMSAG